MANRPSAFLIQKMLKTINHGLRNIWVLGYDINGYSYK